MINDDLALYHFHQGTNFSAYNYLGCNSIFSDGVYYYSFRTWAPNADCVELVSDFSGWATPLKLTRVSENGVWELIYTSAEPLDNMGYKFLIHSPSGAGYKADPYAKFSRGGADGTSLIFTSQFKFTDHNWLLHRRAAMREKDGAYLSTPINIYEVHLASFLRHEDGTYLSYRELADTLAPYVKAMGYTHVELLPISEYPFDGSWGYQICGYYAPTSRLGNPDDFGYFVNTMHNIGVGVILDWVPAHFPKDEWGLCNFDGQPLYEYQGKDRMESRSWGTRYFDLGRQEVQSFLVSNALYFIREFHIDGLRVDAVASMLYLDYDREPGEWVPNCYGTNINLEAVAFLQKFNSAVHDEFPDVLTIAEESTSYGKITTPVSEGGLGFSMKWNMGWANDFYDYAMTDPYFRKHKHKALNFPIMYAFTENYCLPISHDEVVHGKLSYLDKMFGEHEDKLMQMRASLLYMMTFPGKKLMFMGTEYAPYREWNYDDSLEWFMLEYPDHRQMRDYVRSLNHFYLTRRELWTYDFDECGFEWIYADEAEKNIICYKRRTKHSELIVAVNFSGASQTISIPLKKNKSPGILFASIPQNVKITDIYKQNNIFYVNVTLEKFTAAIMNENNRKIPIGKEKEYVL